MGQGRKVAQLEILITRNVIGCADGREHFRLLNRVDAEVGFEIEVQIQHVLRVAGLLSNDLQHLIFNRVVGSRLYCDRGLWGRFLFLHCSDRDLNGPARRARLPILRKLDHVGQGGEVAQLEILVSGNVIGRADGGKHLRLFNRVDAEVGFQIEIQVQHVPGVAGLLSNDLQHLVFNGVIGSRLCCDRGRRGGDCRNISGDGARRGRRGRPNDEIGTVLMHKPDYVRQRWIVAQLPVLVPRNVVYLADCGKHFRLFDRVNSKIRFQIEVQVQHVLWITCFFHGQGKNAFFNGIAVLCTCRGGNGNGCDFLCRLCRY